MNPKRIRPLAHRILAAAVLTLAGTSSKAAIDTWVGNTSVNWADANWTGGNNPPIDGDSLVFGLAGTAGPLLNNNLTPGIAIAGITFNADASNYTFTGNSLLLTGNIVNNSSSLQTINLDLVVDTPRTFTTSGTGGDITLGGVISGIGSISKLSTTATAPFGTLTLLATP